MLDLVEMAPCHRFARKAVSIVQYLAKKCNVEIDIERDRLALEGSGRVFKPYTPTFDFLTPNVQGGDSICNYGTTQVIRKLESMKADEAADIQKAGDTMVDHLSFPFPMQGQPMLPIGQELEQSGFALL